MRSPLTGILFALELTHDVNALLPLLIACMTGHAFTVLVLPRSILTEKVARRGYHLTREYTVDPLEALTVDEVMSPDVVTVPADLPARELEQRFLHPRSGHTHQGYPVLDAGQRLVGVVTRSNLLAFPHLESTDGYTVADLLVQPAIVAHEDETCLTVAERMADAEVGRLPVVARGDPDRVVGIVTRPRGPAPATARCAAKTRLPRLLKARERYLELERQRERLLWQGRR